METNGNDHEKRSNTETRNENLMVGNNEERKKEDQMKKNNRGMKNKDHIGGNDKKRKKDDPVKENNMVTNEESHTETTNTEGNEEHQTRGKSRNIHDEDLTEESSVGKQKKDRKVFDMMCYAERLQDILTSEEKLHPFRDDCFSHLTSSQQEVFGEVVKAVNSGQGQCFFVEDRFGLVKFDLLNAILATVQIKYGKDSALATSSRQLTSLLLLGGRTFHYMFNAFLDVSEDSNLQITKGSPLAEIIGRAKVIVVDGAVSLTRIHIEQLDVKLRELNDSEKVFGGMVIVLAGDFRKLLPVFRRDEIELVINRSNLWPEFKVVTLRAQEEGSSDGKLDKFEEWLNKLGNGDLPHVTAPDLYHKRDCIELPEDMCMKLREQKWEESLRALIQFVFPSFDENVHDCAILAPTKVDVQAINEACMKFMPGTIETCLSDDTITECTCRSKPSHICPCSSEMPDLPPHRLDLKIGVPLILLATLQTEELSTGTLLTLNTGSRVTLKTICDEYLECTVAGGQVVNIPNEWFRSQSIAPWDGKERHQFPVQVTFATTIHKSQGLMLNRVGVWLEKDVFTHGQLYAAASCVERREDIRFVLQKRARPPYYVTRNVVFKEVFQATLPDRLRKQYNTTR